MLREVGRSGGSGGIHRQVVEGEIDAGWDAVETGRRTGSSAAASSGAAKKRQMLESMRRSAVLRGSASFPGGEIVKMQSLLLLQLLQLLMVLLLLLLEMQRQRRMRRRCRCGRGDGAGRCGVSDEALGAGGRSL